jgi:hypothetical protein
MRRNKFPKPWILGAVALMSLLALSAVASAQTYEVTITNLTKGQIFSPPIVYTHRSSFDLFTPGEPAIPELAGVAEDAASEPLIALLSAEPRVADVAAADGLVLPGESMTVQVEARGRARNITALGMLVTTNDAFFAAEKSVPAFSTSVYATAWDAGSEANTQDCAHIPGPPCGNGGVRVEDGAEGYVYVHTGIQDRGSLSPEDHDWRNPVAKIVIRHVTNS